MSTESHLFLAQSSRVETTPFNSLIVKEELPSADGKSRRGEGIHCSNTEGEGKWSMTSSERIGEILILWVEFKADLNLTMFYQIMEGFTLGANETQNLHHHFFFLSRRIFVVLAIKTVKFLSVNLLYCVSSFFALLLLWCTHHLTMVDKEFYESHCFSEGRFWQLLKLAVS